tara:strand:+ start:139 stop:603 length:465 start_codon:yes stop_codon:yes gene_type:complete
MTFNLASLNFDKLIPGRLLQSPAGATIRGYLAESNGDTVFRGGTAGTLNAEGKIVKSLADSNIQGIVVGNTVVDSYSFNKNAVVNLARDGDIMAFVAGETLQGNEFVEFEPVADNAEFDRVKKHTGVNTRIGTVIKGGSLGDIIVVEIKIFKPL